MVCMYNVVSVCVHAGGLGNRVRKQVSGLLGMQLHDQVKKRGVVFVGMRRRGITIHPSVQAKIRMDDFEDKDKKKRPCSGGLES